MKKLVAKKSLTALFEELQIVQLSSEQEENLRGGYTINLIQP